MHVMGTFMYYSPFGFWMQFDIDRAWYNLQGSGKDEEAMIAVMLSRSNAEIQDIKEAYKQCE